jgi:hypothetical protein
VRWHHQHAMLKRVVRGISLVIAVLLFETGIVGIPGSIASQAHVIGPDWAVRVVASLLAVVAALAVVGPERLGHWKQRLTSAGSQPADAVPDDVKEKLRELQREGNALRRFNCEQAYVFAGSAGIHWHEDGGNRTRMHEWMLEMRQLIDERIPEHYPSLPLLPQGAWPGAASRHQMCGVLEVQLQALSKIIASLP